MERVKALACPVTAAEDNVAYHKETHGVQQKWFSVDKLNCVIVCFMESVFTYALTAVQWRPVFLGGYFVYLQQDSFAQQTWQPSWHVTMDSVLAECACRIYS